MTATKVLSLEEQALALPIEKRALLVQRLLTSLHELPEDECNDLWCKEAEARFRAYKEGQLTSQSAEEVLASIRRDLAT